MRRAHAYMQRRGALPVSLPDPDNETNTGMHDACARTRTTGDDATTPTVLLIALAVVILLCGVPPAIDCRVCTCGTMY